MTSKTVQHSPTPWALDDTPATDSVRQIAHTRHGHRIEVINATRLICATDGNAPDMDDDESDANARMIILAVNSHADLLAACKAMRSSLDVSEFAATSKLADAAIAAAQGPTT